MDAPSGIRGSLRLQCLRQPAVKSGGTRGDMNIDGYPNDRVGLGKSDQSVPVLSLSNSCCCCSSSYVATAAAEDGRGRVVAAGW
jgi:hypothetical protein